MKIKLFGVIIVFFTTLLYADLLKENFIIFDLNGSSPKAILDFESDNLEKFIELDDSKNGIISWKEIKAHRKEIEKFVLSHLKISIDGKVCNKTVDQFEVYRRVHQSYIKLDLSLSCIVPKEVIGVKYDLFFDVDKDQKAFVKITDNNNRKPVILSNRNVEVSLSLQKESGWQAFVDFLTEGIWHIWKGYDHILFLLMLLLPSVYCYRDEGLYLRSSFKDVLIEVLKVVTGFSLAHSITLGLSVGEIVVLNSTFVEVAIATSVLFAAVNNLYPLVKYHTWIIAFGFGLIHGFGFANVLHDLLVQNSSDFLIMLLGFNFGVEIGQMAIVFAILPLIYFLSQKTTFYKKYILYMCSTLTVVISLLWVFERVYNLSLLPF